MSTTIDTSKKPDWFNISDFQDKVYWTYGIQFIGEISSFPADVVAFADSKEAAYEERALCLQEEDYIENGLPTQITRERANEIAKSHNATKIQIEDINGDIVESWNVN